METARQHGAVEAVGRGRSLSRRQLVGTIVGLQLALLLAALDGTIVGTAMPRVIAQLNGFERYAWVTTAFMLTSTIAVPIFGKLSDLYGRKRFYLPGTALFVLASALCDAAGELPLPIDAMNQLILVRDLQGLVGGIVMAITLTVVGDLFPPAERGTYQGLFSAVWGVVSVFGPTLGGWITEHLSWRWVFYVNLPVGVVALAVLYVAFPDFRPTGSRRRIDWAGVAALAGGLVPLLLGLTWASARGWSDAGVLALLAVGTVLLGVFVRAESRAAEPIVPLSLFREPVVAISLASLLITGLGMFGAILYIPLFMQNVIGVSAATSGSLLTPMMLTMVVAGIVIGQLVSRTGRYKPIALGGLALVTGGVALLAGMGLATTQVEVVRTMLVLGLGLGLLQPVYTVVVQNAAPRRLLGAATSATQLARSVGDTAGTAVFGSIMLARYRDRFAAGVPAAAPEPLRQAFANPLQLDQILASASSTLGDTPAGQQLIAALTEAVRASLVYALGGVFLVAALFLGLAFVVNLCLPEIPFRGRPSNAATDPADSAASRDLAADSSAIRPAEVADTLPFRPPAAYCSLRRPLCRHADHPCVTRVTVSAAAGCEDAGVESNERGGRNRNRRSPGRNREDPQMKRILSTIGVATAALALSLSLAGATPAAAAPAETGTAAPQADLCNGVYYSYGALGGVRSCANYAGYTYPTYYNYGLTNSYAYSLTYPYYYSSVYNPTYRYLTAGTTYVAPTTTYSTVVPSYYYTPATTSAVVTNYTGYVPTSYYAGYYSTYPGYTYLAYYR